MFELGVVWTDIFIILPLIPCVPLLSNFIRDGETFKVLGVFYCTIGTALGGVIVSTPALFIANAEKK